MDFGFEGLIVAIVFIIPGFIATHIRVSRTSVRPPNLSAFQEMLASLTSSSIISILQLTTLAFLYWRLPLVHENVDSVIKGGILQYARSNPNSAMLVLISWGIFVLILSILIGYLDPIERIARWNRHRLGIPDDFDLWHSLFVQAPRQAGYDICYIRVWLKSGTAYEGWLESFELPGEKDKPRLFWLIGAKRWGSHAEALLEEPTDRIPSVLLKYDDDVSSIDVRWE